jgi:SAM-dependent methyltransferase
MPAPLGLRAERPHADAKRADSKPAAASPAADTPAGKTPAGKTPAGKTWREWWNAPHSIYVNAQHLRVHYAHVADVIIGSLPERRPLAVLDYGCGEALDAVRVADAAGSLILYDSAERVRRAVAGRCRGRSDIQVVDEVGLLAIAPSSLDVVVVYSVIQYMTREEFTAALARWWAWLRPGGMLLLVDVVPPGAGMLDDVAALVATAWRHGFLRAAMRGLASTLFSSYSRMRRQRGLTAYAEPELRGLLEAAGFAAQRRPFNLHGHRARMTMVCERRV